MTVSTSPAPPAADAATSDERRGLGARSLVSFASAVVGLAALWYAVSYLILSPPRRFLLPPPHEAFATALGAPATRLAMLAALGHTAMIAVIGLCAAALIGIAYAIVMSQWALAERMLYPYAVILQTIPILALVPLIGIWLGYGTSARITVCVIIALFPMISNSLFGLRSAGRDAHDLFTIHRARRWQRLMKLQLPAAVPSIFTGLRTAAGLSVIGAIVGDFYFQQGTLGVGGLLRVYTQSLQTEALFTAVALTSLFGVAVFTIFAIADRAVIARWYGR